ncbi:hypothetical protein AB0H34_08780 [Saccharopolyspora shandongensis]|uniref:hypothetical protein n=1 Tax=Saccharopolyspora shandongensis TaxID=418495 RepID=UPI00340C902B
MTPVASRSRMPEIALPEGFEPVPLPPVAAEQGARILGRFTAGDPPVSLALAVGVAPLHALPLPAVAIASSLVVPYRRRHPAAQVGVVMLANGPALVALHAGAYRLPPEGTREELLLPRIKAEVQVPDGDRMVVVSVAGARQDDWPAVIAEATRLAGSVEKGRSTRAERDR